jgi:hypothetical protein
MEFLNNDENGAKPLVILSWLSAYISLGTAQQFVSLLSGIVAIVSGLSAIRYYYIKSKTK